jgi:Ubiquitin-activating enzyme E1 FCCH domain
VNTATTINYTGELSAIVTRADGSVEDFGILSSRPVSIIVPKLSFWERTWNFLKREGKIPAAMGLGIFIAWMLSDHHSATLLGVVTTAGADYMAADFLSSSSNHINAFNEHDCGTGGAHGSTVSISGATNATPIVIQTSTAHGLTSNDLVTISSVGGNTNANGNWQITVVDSTHFDLIGSVGNSAYTSGGTVQLLNGAGDTGLTTAAGTSRVAGTQSNPSANIYQTVATISFTSSLTISEWGLFSASSSGTLWDRRWFNTSGAPATTATGALTGSTIGVNSGDSIAFTYQLTVNQGGS